MKYLRIAVLVLSTVYAALGLQAQELLGNTGGMNIPTAEMLPAGTFRCGVNYMGEGIVTAELGNTDHRWQFEYNTMNYYLNMTVFDWLELTFRETILESDSYGQKDDYKLFREQDRSVTAKVRVTKEGRYMPAIALGVNDPYSFTGHHIYASAWGVMTKSLHTAMLASTWTATVGYAQGFDNSRMYDGLLIGLRYTPDFLPTASLMAEYDSKGFNLGIKATLFDHMGVYCFLRDFESFNAGINYQTTIKF